MDTAVSMTEEELQRGATFYGISIQEARRRNEVLMAHRNNADDPICGGCARRPNEMPDSYPLEDGESAKDFVLREEGTLNTQNGHFLCDECYIKNGMPSSPHGWVCP